MTVRWLVFSPWHADRVSGATLEAAWQVQGVRLLRDIPVRHGQVGLIRRHEAKADT